MIDNPDIEYTTPKIPLLQLATCLLSEAEPIAKRMRSVFLLKQINTIEAIDVLQAAIGSPSVLLKHEICYVLGQMQNTYSLKFLEATLRDKNQHPIVRHEAAEAIAAIGLEDSIPLLEEMYNDPNSPSEVKDTCEIAIDKYKYKNSNKTCACKSYYSVDPAPAFEETHTISELTNILTDPKKSLFDRYRAMFSLRDIGTDEAVLALATGFNDDNALFKHEIAFVFGQMQHKASIKALKEVLMKEDEHSMVRHEAAEALGSVLGEADSNDSSNQNDLLKEFVEKKSEKPDDDIVKQSCEVALDIQDYWSSDQFDSAL